MSPGGFTSGATAFSVAPIGASLLAVVVVVDAVLVSARCVAFGFFAQPTARAISAAANGINLRMRISLGLNGFLRRRSFRRWTRQRDGEGVRRTGFAQPTVEGHASADQDAELGQGPRNLELEISRGLIDGDPVATHAISRVGIGRAQRNLITVHDANVHCAGPARAGHPAAAAARLKDDVEGR